jgi:hypothetical protein|uniref:Uncharacterized protein n=1 Tax=Picea glauca TaxID=3330 RepID=A0A117NH36_PICGL|nr:hypothetical protein ABT39_MTgene5955 [Picea glauca]
MVSPSLVAQPGPLGYLLVSTSFQAKMVDQGHLNESTMRLPLFYSHCEQDVEQHWFFYEKTKTGVRRELAMLFAQYNFIPLCAGEPCNGT